MKTLDGETLREAREYLALSQTEAAELLEVTLVTYQRWERGETRPHPYNLRMIRLKFKPALLWLGLIEYEPEEKPDVTPRQEGATTCTSVVPPLLSLTVPSEEGSMTHVDERAGIMMEPMTLHLLSFAYMVCPTNNDRPDLVRRAIKEFDIMNSNNKNYQITRREAISTLASLPLATLGLTASGNTVQPTRYATTLTHCSASLEACWELSKSSEPGDILLAFRRVSQYLPILETIANNASQYRQEALDLAARYALVKTCLGWHRVGPLATVPYAKDAVLLSQEGGDISLELSAYSKLAWTLFFGKHYLPALQTAQEAEARLQEHLRLKDAPPLHPCVFGQTYMNLALMQARNGRSADTALGKATEVDLSNEMYAFIDYTRSDLPRQEGQVYCYQGNLTKATEMLEQCINPQTLVSRVPQSERGRLETIHGMTLAALRTKDRDMEQVIHFWTAGIKGAKALKSEKNFGEAVALYDLMEIIWFGEKRIADLRELTEHW